MKVLVVGAGRVGLRMASMLHGSGGFQVTVADCVRDALGAAAESGCATMHVDASRARDLRRVAETHDAVVAAVPDRVVPVVAETAIACGAHYLDFSNAEARTRAAGHSAPAGRAFLSGCGISPGLVDQIAAELVAAFDADVDLTVRVGAIPARRANRLGYGLIWNLDGLFAEYTGNCEAIVDGRIVELPPMSSKEEFTLDGEAYEAFCTAGGVGNLAGHLGSKVRNLVFRTIRYPGHLDYMGVLLDDLGLRKRRDMFMTVLSAGLPAIDEDMVLIYATARGIAGGRQEERSTVLRIDGKAGAATGASGSALALGSAAHGAAILDLVRAGALPAALLGRSDCIALARVLENRFLGTIAWSKSEHGGATVSEQMAAPGPGRG